MLLTAFGHWLLWSFQCRACSALHLIVEIFKVLDVVAKPEVSIKLLSSGVQMEITRWSFFVWAWLRFTFRSWSISSVSSSFCKLRSAPYILWSLVGLPFPMLSKLFLPFDEAGRVLIVAAKPDKLPSSTVKIGIVKKPRRWCVVSPVHQGLNLACHGAWCCGSLPCLYKI